MDYTNFLLALTILHDIPALGIVFVDLNLLTFDQFWTFFQVFGHVKLHHGHVQQCQHCQFDRI